MNAQEFKNSKELKENLADVLYALQHVEIDGRSLANDMKVNGFIKMSKEGEIKEEVTNLRTALSLSKALVSMTENVKTPRNSGVSGAIWSAENKKK